jgi:hypothetical protein
MRRRGCEAALGKWYSNWDTGYERNVCSLDGVEYTHKVTMEDLRACPRATGGTDDEHMAARLLGCSFATTEEWDADACSTLHSATHCTAKACRPNRQTCAKCDDVPHSTCDDLQKLRFVIATDTDTGEENFSGHGQWDQRGRLYVA